MVWITSRKRETAMALLEQKWALGERLHQFLLSLSLTDNFKDKSSKKKTIMPKLIEKYHTFTLILLMNIV